jgi:hypothetical protein
MSLEAKKKFMSPRWTEKENEIVISLFKERKSFEEISIVVNNHLRTFLNQYEFINVRTPIAIAWQCRKLKLIAKARLENYIKRYSGKVIKDRRRDIYSVRKRVFERDGKICIICNSNEELTYCHLIPFRKTRKITLCESHHKEFDRNNEAVVRKVYEKMCFYYPEYSQKYSLDVCCGKHWHIKKNETEEAH